MILGDVQEVFSVGQEEWLLVDKVSRLELCHLRNFSSGSCHPIDNAIMFFAEQDGAVCAPGANTRFGSHAIHQSLRISGRRADLLHHSTGKKSEVLAVGGPERVRGIFCPSQNCCLLRIEGAKPQLRHPFFVHGGEGQRFAVRRNSNGPDVQAAGRAERGSRRRRDVCQHGKRRGVCALRAEINNAGRDKQNRGAD